MFSSMIVDFSQASVPQYGDALNTERYSYSLELVNVQAQVVFSGMAKPAKPAKPAELAELADVEAVYSQLEARVIRLEEAVACRDAYYKAEDSYDRAYAVYDREIDGTYDHYIPKKIRKYHGSFFRLIAKVYRYVVEFFFPPDLKTLQAGILRDKVNSLVRQLDKLKPLRCKWDTLPENVSIDPIDQVIAYKNIAKGMLEAEVSRIKKKLIQARELPLAELKNLVAEMFDDRHLTTDFSVREAFSQAKLDFWKAFLNGEQSPQKLGPFLEALRESAPKKRVEGKRYAQLRIQELERELRMEISSKQRLLLPNPHQMKSATINWDMPVPSAMTIPKAPQKVDILKVKDFYRMIEPLLPSRIEDDRDDEGNVLRWIDKKSFRERIFSSIDRLSKGEAVADGYQNQVSSDLREKIVNFLRHFVLWVERQKQNESEEALKTDLRQIFQEQLGLVFFHCTDRMATELTRIYDERIMGMYTDTHNPYELLRIWVVKRRRQWLEATILEMIPRGADQASTLRFYMKYFAPQLGLGNDSMTSTSSGYGSYAADISRRLHPAVERFQRDEASFLLKEITKKIRCVDDKEPPFAYATLSSLFTERYLAEGTSVEQQLLDKEEYLWRPEATAQLLFDAGVFSPFKAPKKPPFMDHVKDLFS